MGGNFGANINVGEQRLEMRESKLRTVLSWTSSVRKTTAGQLHRQFHTFAFGPSFSVRHFHAGPLFSVHSFQPTEPETKLRKFNTGTMHGPVATCASTGGSSWQLVHLASWRTNSNGLDVSTRQGSDGWLRGTVVERRSVTGELSLSYARPAADGWLLSCG